MQKKFSKVNSMLKVMTVVGTRPEIIKLSEVIKELDKSSEHTLVHTGQNYDFTLNEIFFKQLNVRSPNYFLNAATKDNIKTISNIISKLGNGCENPDHVFRTSINMFNLILVNFLHFLGNETSHLVLTN